MTKIMLVDDETSVTEALKRTIRRAHSDWEIDDFSNPEDALKQLKIETYNVIISDYKMSPIDGVVFLSESKIFQKEAKRIILSGQGDMNAVVSAINSAEIYRYIHKPVNSNELVLAIEQALMYQEIETENDRLANLVRRLQKTIDMYETKIKTLCNMSPEVKKIIDDLNIEIPS